MDLDLSVLTFNIMHERDRKSKKSSLWCEQLKSAYRLLD